ncbi:MAG: GNAT family N-acetyltransferase [Thermomicrobiales bacterium]
MDHEGISVVFLAPEEWQELRTIRLEALRSEPQAFSSTYAETLLRPDVYWRDRLASDRSVTLIARSDQRPIGLVGGYFGSDEGDESVAIVVSMYVNQAYRGRGIGRWLLRSLVARLAADRRIATIRLWVRPGQQPACQLYESLGFRVAGESVDADGVELIMELRVR